MRGLTLREGLEQSYSWVGCYRNSPESPFDFNHTDSWLICASKAHGQ